WPPRCRPEVSASAATPAPARNSTSAVAASTLPSRRRCGGRARSDRQPSGVVVLGTRPTSGRFGAGPGRYRLSKKSPDGGLAGGTAPPGPNQDTGAPGSGAGGAPGPGAGGAPGPGTGGAPGPGAGAEGSAAGGADPEGSGTAGSPKGNTDAREAAAGNACPTGIVASGGGWTYPGSASATRCGSQFAPDSTVPSSVRISPGVGRIRGFLARQRSTKDRSRPGSPSVAGRSWATR